jgi:hypothetical protein
MATQYNNSESSSLNSEYPKNMAMPNQYGFGTLAPHKIISAATANETFIKIGGASVYGICLTNTGATAAYVRIFDKASIPVSATDLSIMTICIPAAAAAGAGSNGVNNVFLPVPVGLKLGLGINITGLATDLDVTAVASEQIVGTILWR